MSINDGEKLSDQEQRLFDYFKKVISGPQVTEIDLYMNKKNQIGVGFNIGIRDGKPMSINAIELEDVERNNSEHFLSSAMMLHEIWESYLAQNAPKYKGKTHETAYKYIQRRKE